MDRRMFWIGSLLLLVTLGLWVADAAAWIPQSTDDRFAGMTLKAGIVALGLALALRLYAPVATMRQRGRCAVCGHSTERGHVYCQDHLQETVNTTRDLAHTRMSAGSRNSR